MKNRITQQQSKINKNNNTMSNTNTNECDKKRNKKRKTKAKKTFDDLNEFELVLYNMMIYKK